MGNLDNLETPNFDYQRIVTKVGLGIPDIDIMSSKQNRKTRRYIDKKKNLFKTELKDFKLGFCNSPHSIYKNTIQYLVSQYKKHEFNCIVLIPANNVRTSYWQKLIEPNNIFWNKNGFTYWYPYDKPIKFQKNGRHLLNKHGRPEHAHNAYFILILLKKSKVNLFKNKVIGWYS